MFICCHQHGIHLSLLQESGSFTVATIPKETNLILLSKQEGELICYFRNGCVYA